jgi:hypothetical protein
MAKTLYEKLMEPIVELLDSCTVETSDTETVYKPMASPPDKVIAHRLDIAQGGAYFFHKALKRAGRPTMKGYA